MKRTIILISCFLPAWTGYTQVNQIAADKSNLYRDSMHSAASARESPGNYAFPVYTDTLHIVELKELIVTGKKDQPSQRLVNFFRSTNASTLEDILSRLPELSLVRRGSYGMEPAIRSFSGGQINVLIDGMRIHGACTDKMDPATIYIEPVNLESLEVQTAKNGFMSGSSIGGTVNMKIAEPELSSGQKIRGVVSSGYQTAARSFYESVRLNYSGERWAVGTSGTYRKNESYRSGGGKVVDFSQFEKLNYSLSLKYQPDQHNAIRGDIILDEGWNIGFPALPMDVGKAAANIASVSYQREDRSSRLYSFRTKIYANRIRHSMDDTRRPDVPVHMDMPGLSETVGLYAEGELKLTDRQKLEFRADGASTFLTASMTMYQPGQQPMYMLTWPDNKKEQYGVSASWTLFPDSVWKIQTSGRLDRVTARLSSAAAKDQIGIFGYDLSSRSRLLKNLSVQFTRKAGKKLSMSASMAYSERMASSSEMYGFYLFNAGDGYDYIGNPDLRQEAALQADITAVYSWGRNRVQATYYYTRVFNYISGLVRPELSTMTIGANGVRSFSNIPYAGLTGIEASCFLKPSWAFDIISTLRYTAGKDNMKEPLALVAPLKSVTAVRYQFKKLFFRLEYEAAAGQSKVRAAAGENKTPGYRLLHAGCGYRVAVLNNPAEIQAGVENVFDRQYHEHLDWGDVPRPGRNLYLQLRLSF